MKTQAEKIKALSELESFLSTSNYYRYSPQLFPRVLLTDGVKYLADTAECYWLIDAIAGAALYEPAIQEHPELQSIQFWTLRVHEDQSATLTCEWDLGEQVYIQEIWWTDFPLPKQQIWVSIEGDRIILLLASEY